MTTTSKVCSCCKETKALELFSKHKSNKDGYRKVCKACRSLQEGERYRNNPDKTRDTTYKRLYGLSLHDYNNLVDKQQSLCKICSKPFQKLYVDHCHQTGEVRGLLCSKCNLGLGQYDDRPDLLRQAALYLEKFYEENV